MADTQRGGAARGGQLDSEWRLGGALVLAVLAFDLCSVFTPGLAGMALFGTPFTLGTLYAFLFVAAVIASAVGHVRRRNRAESGPESRTP